MNPLTIIVILLLFIAFVCIWNLIAARIIFWNTLTRKKGDTWSREVSFPAPELHEMYDVGVGYMNLFADKKIDLHTVNEGLNLYSEYYNFGYDRTVIIVPGRTEGLIYSYYYTKAYIESGYNVLVIDQRCHGKSDGKYSSFGFNESRDILHWGEILHNEYGVKSIVLHGICIGCACSLYALTSENCPDYFTAFIADGMYANFYLSFKRRMKRFHAPSFMTLDFVNVFAKHYTGHSMKVGPIDKIQNYKKPLLMLHSDADFFSVPQKAKELFAKAGTPESQKRLIWFENCVHSRLRLTFTEKYDNSIKEFLSEVVDKQTATK